MPSHKQVVIVTGGAGFIGSHLVRRLVARKDYHVVTVDKLTYAGNLDSLTDVLAMPNHEFVRADICDPTAIAAILAKYRPAQVYHLAAESHVDRSIDGPQSFVQTNVIGTCTLLQQVLGYWQSLPAAERDQFRLLHVSTDEVFGSLGREGFFTEESPYAPRSPYSASKAAADHFARAFHHTYGLPVVVTNCSNNFGPYQFPEKLIPLMILSAIEGKPLPVYGDGMHVRDWLFVEDHCRALQLVMERGTPGETYSIGANCERTNLEVVAAICECVDRLKSDLPQVPTAGLITFVPDRPGHDFRYAIDASKIQKALGWQPEYDFAAALVKTVEWYLDNLAWVSRVTTGVYHGERLGTLPHTILRN
jgi:dTDP-glucose 4,6-dehydratase